jgi:capsular exopolysaccharide synthesis family protein
MNDQSPEQIDLRAYVRPIWRRKLLIASVVVIAGVAAYFVSKQQAKKYTASTNIYIQSANPATNLLTDATPTSLQESQVDDIAALITSRAVTAAVAAQLKISPEAATGHIVATASSTSDIVTIVTSYGDSTGAANLANAFARQFLKYRSRQVVVAARKAQNADQSILASLSLRSKSLAVQSERETILGQIAQYQQIRLDPNPGASQISPAVAPGVPSSPKPKKDAVFAAVAGLVLAVIAVFGLELLDRRLLSVSAVESMYNSPVVAVLPLIRVPAPRAGQTPVLPIEFIEELRMLRLRINAATEGRDPKRILVTSGLSGEGKSTVVRDLALMFAGAGERVVVVDTDLRKPTQSSLFGVSKDTGLLHLLTHHAELADVISHVDLTVSGGPHDPADDEAQATGAVDVIAHGERTNNPGVLLSSPAMSDLLQQLDEQYDRVLIDTAPILTVADCVPLLEKTDANLVVARVGLTSRQTASRFTDLVAHLPGVTISGVVANAAPVGGDEGYGTHSQYGYSYNYAGQSLAGRSFLPRRARN